MASKLRIIFFLVLSIQLTVLLSYLALGNYMFVFSLFTTYVHIRRSPEQTIIINPHVVHEPVPRDSSHQESPLSVTGQVIGPPLLDVKRAKVGDQEQQQSSNTTLSHTSPMTETLGNRSGNRTTQDNTDSFDLFQTIDGKEAWLYSAFYDYVAAGQNRPRVRIFGVALRELNIPTSCNLSDAAAGTSFLTKGQLTWLNDAKGVSAPPVYVECVLIGGVRPTHVSVSFLPNVTVWTNRLPIQYPGPRTRNFTVCFSAFHSRFNRAAQLIESIEMNRVLGVEHFMIYNYSISPQVNQILHQYEVEGVVSVIPWPIPTLKSWYFGQIAAINDCLYRNRNVSRFVAVVDTDELIIPRTASDSWMEMIYKTSPQEADVAAFMNSQSPAKKKKSGCFLAKCSFFSVDSKPNWKAISASLSPSEEMKRNITKYNLLILSQTVRSQEIFPPRRRSKYIARPEEVYIGGVHFVHDFIYWQRCHTVPHDIALMHHYRLRGLTKNTINDTTAFNYLDKLYPRVMNAFSKFPHIFN